MSLVEIRITAPDVEVADRIAQTLVERRLAACVQQLPGIRSTYVWEGRIERADEILLLVKTTAERFDAVREAVTTLHHYEVPEILAVDITMALGDYEDWVLEHSRP